LESILFSALLGLAPHLFLTAAGSVGLLLLIGFAPGAHAQTTPTVSIARQGDGVVTEGSDVVFRVTASHAVSANLTVGDDDNADFVSSDDEGSQSVVIASGASTADFTLSTVGDSIDEANGAVSVAVNSGVGYTVGSPSFATVAVNDDDATTVTLSVPDATAAEGSSTDRATVRLSLNRALLNGESLAIPLAFSGGVLGTDFSLSLSGSPAGVALSNGTVTFTGSSGGSATTADVLLSASEDVDGVDETVTVSIPSVSTGNTPILTATLLGGGATGSRTGNGQVVLSDDDTPALVFSAMSVTVAEGSSGSYTVRLATLPTGTVTVTVGGATGEVTVDTNRHQRQSDHPHLHHQRQRPLEYAPAGDGGGRGGCRHGQ